MEEFFFWQDNPDCHFMDESDAKDDLVEDDEEFSEAEDLELFDEEVAGEIGVEHIMGIGGALGGMFEEAGSTPYESTNVHEDTSPEYIPIKDAFRSSNETNPKAFPIRPFEKWVQDVISGKKSLDDDLDL